MSIEKVDFPIGKAKQNITHTCKLRKLQNAVSVYFEEQKKKNVFNTFALDSKKVKYS